jgi:cysteine synthase A
MFRVGARTFATTARRVAETVVHMEAPNQYGIGVSKAQGIVKGLTGGRSAPPL